MRFPRHEMFLLPLLVALLFVGVQVTSIIPAHAVSSKGRIQVAPLPPALSVEALFSEPSGNSVLDAEEAGKITVTVRNDGAGDGYDVVGSVTLAKAVTGLAVTRDLSFGTVPAKGKAVRIVELAAGEALTTGEAKVEISFRESNRFEPDPVSVAFTTRAMVPPSLEVAGVGIDDSNGDGKVSPGEIVEVTVRIRNAGRGEARGVVAEIEAGQNVTMTGEATGREIGRLAPGETRDVKFSFYANKAVKNGEPIPLSVRLRETRPQFVLAKSTLGLAMNAPARKSTEIVVAPTGPTHEPEIAKAASLEIDIERDIPRGAVKAGSGDIAVVVGNRDYSPVAHDVEYALRDAESMKDHLVTTFGFDPKNVIHIKNATLTDFNKTFGSNGRPDTGILYKRVEAASRGGKVRPNVFVYYVGHGAPDPASQEAFFVPVGSAPESLEATGYPLKGFYANLGALPASKVTIVLDACFSGNSDRGMLLKGVSPASLRVKSDYAAPLNSLLLTSGATDQVSVWYPEKKHSLFTYYFLKGLRGEAVDSATGAVTAGSMRRYLDSVVPGESLRLKSVSQTPVVTAASDDEVIVRVAK